LWTANFSSWKLLSREEDRVPRDRLIEEILDHLQLMGAEVEHLAGAAAGSVRMNRTDLRALQVLRTSDGMTAGQLARALQVTSGATTRVIDSLVAVGHATRQADARDRRRVVVRLTQDAEELFDRSFERLREQTRGLLEAYHDEELEVVARFLADVRGLLRAHARRLARPAH
jgi:DNA-binding MarR family transcriptional regulator